jgi:hypothetical protein
MRHIHKNQQIRLLLWQSHQEKMAALRRPIPSRCSRRCRRRSPRRINRHETYILPLLLRRPSALLPRSRKFHQPRERRKTLCGAELLKLHSARRIDHVQRITLVAQIAQMVHCSGYTVAVGIGMDAAGGRRDVCCRCAQSLLRRDEFVDFEDDV